MGFSYEPIFFLIKKTRSGCVKIMVKFDIIDWLLAQMQIACKKPCCARQAVLITDCASAKAISRTIQFLQEKDNA